MNSKVWLVEAYRANVDVVSVLTEWGESSPLVQVPLGQGEMACRCYRCGTLLTYRTVTVEEIGEEHVRPACENCNSKNRPKPKRATRATRARRGLLEVVK